MFSDLTAKLADLTARRNQLENALRDHGNRAARLNNEIAEIERDLTRAAGDRRPGSGDALRRRRAGASRRRRC